MSLDEKRPLAEKRLEKRLSFLRQAIAPGHPLRIADIGANPINTPDYQPVLDMGYCEVWGFEPEQEAFQALMDNPQPGAHYVQRAVGKNGKGTFYHHPQSGLGSLFPVRKESVHYLGHPSWYKPDGKTFEVDIVEMDSISDDLLPKPDVLKIDIQGGELDVIANGKAKLSDAVAIIPEIRHYRIYENEPLWGKLDVELHGQGFVLHKLLFSKSTAVKNSQRKRMKNKAFRNQLIDGDAVYIRNPETIGDWSDEQVKQLAIASAAVFNSFDLTVYCLDELVERGIADASTPEDFMEVLPNWMLSEE